MTRIGFTMTGRNVWDGGYNYLLNLLRVITQRRPKALDPVLFIGTDVNYHDIIPFQSIVGLKIVISPQMDSARRNLSLLKSVLFGADPGTQQMFYEHCIEVVFENAQFHGASLGIPTIAWIPDFQHRELPHFFSIAAWWKRELGFRAQISSGRNIMLSSQDARDACERYYPATIGRTYVVRFAIPPQERANDTEISRIRVSYGLPKRYFYLPNQFWQHKNHLLVIEALALLKQEHPDIVIVASGRQLDPNKPKYFQRVLFRLKQAGLGDQFRLLGLIPYEHIAPLMLGSIAVLNPSLFEGWSTTVEEAISLQVPLILSDLPVHKEQAIGIATFFDRTSARSLADVLRQAWQDQPPSTTDFTSLTNSVVDPVERFADDFANLVHRAAGVGA